MTAVTDAITMIEILVGHPVDNATLLRIADRYVSEDPFSLADFVDPQNPTNEEKAQLFLDTHLEEGKALLGRSSDREQDASFIPTKDAARASVVADLE